MGRMIEKASKKFAQVAKAIAVLPEDTQDAILAEFEARVADYSQSHLSGDQRQEVRRRLALPRHYVAEEHIRSIFSAYNRA